MALVQDYIPFRVTLMDTGANKVTLTFKSTCTTTAGANILGPQLLSAIQALTTAKIIKFGYVFEQAENDTTPPVAAEVENKAEVSAKLVLAGSGPGQTRAGSFSIPAPVVGMFQATAGELFNVVNPAYGPLQTLLALYEAGFGVFGSLTLSDYQTIQDPTVAGNIKGKRIHKASRKG